MKYVKIPMLDDTGREWTRYDGWADWLCGSWFLNEMDWQPTLFKKIKKWLELEYHFFFTPRTTRPKCPTPLSRIHWCIWYKFIYKDPCKELFKNYKRWEKKNEDRR